MVDGPLVNIPDLTRPAVVLLEKISDAVGGMFAPMQLRRMAKAEADALKIKALAEMELTEIQKRALDRLVREEETKQRNMEDITARALPDVRPDSKPETLENDWIAHFYDRCRHTTSEEMQGLWARLLASQVNSASISKRTVDIVASLDRRDAEKFTALCGFTISLPPDIPVVFDTRHTIYPENGVTFESAIHLAEIGLLSLTGSEHFPHHSKSRSFNVYYFGTRMTVTTVAGPEPALPTGHVLLSQAGRELAPLCGAAPVKGFLDYVRAEWIKRGASVDIHTTP